MIKREAFYTNRSSKQSESVFTPVKQVLPNKLNWEVSLNNIVPGKMLKDNLSHVLSSCARFKLWL